VYPANWLSYQVAFFYI